MAESSLGGEARAEYDAAHDWYLDRDAAVAAGFEAAVGDALRMLEQFPGLGTPLDGRHRWHPLRRYPFGLVYRLIDGTVRVVGVPHNRQLPKDWADRE